MGRHFEVRAKAMAASAAAKTKVYSKYGKEIYIAAKSGVPDPAMNMALKRVIEKAKSEQVPADVIKRAIDKAAGGTDESFISVTYEGFGPGNSKFIIECLTNNVNRTATAVKTCFNRAHSKLGVPGCVSHEFDHCAVVSLTDTDEDTVLGAMLEGEVEIDDIESEDGNVIIYGPTTSLYEMKEAAEKAGLNVAAYEITWLPGEYCTVEGEDKEMFDRLINLLNEDDDVQDVYHNVKVD